jgi:uroporphyrinogen decarboxylase
VTFPKERVLQALHHHQPDRVPVGEIGVDYTITEQALGRPTLYRAKWKEYQALWQGRRDEYVESCKRDLVGLARKFEWDFVPVFLVPPRNAPPRPPKFLDTYTWEEPDGRIMQFSPETEGHAVCVQYPTLSLDALQDQAIHIDPSQLELVEHVVRELGGTHFILGRGEDGTFPHERYGLTQLLLAMIDDPPLVKRAIEIETRKAITINEALLDAGCDAVLPGDDYCSARGPMMSPAHWRQYILPALTVLCESAHRKGKYLIKHTDGNTWRLFDMLLEAGIDGWHGIQAAAGMDLARLKERYGERVCFWGGVDVDLLVDGTPDQVRSAVRYAVESAGKEGGLVLTSGNTLMVGVRYENYLAMLQAARSDGR